ncbi:hypothetical protein SED60170_25666 [Salmonella enterica subsp. diarizonae serovar 60:r:e,n,x,z15 str. 01-0170]|nr:hypothetical protein SED60170_25666 [Salmonella enterica subsp. diarizonae serovar 60:r:e,n,x,z15 str. 01-0170]
MALGAYQAYWRLQMPGTPYLTTLQDSQTLLANRLTTEIDDHTTTNLSLFHLFKNNVDIFKRT